MSLDHETLKAEHSFKHAYGRALTEWQKVESAAYRIFYTLMQDAHPLLISTTWFHIQSFDSRLLLLDRCLQFAMSETSRKGWWTPIKKEIDAQLAVRNFLVHGVFEVENYDEDQKGVPVIKPDPLDAVSILRKRRQNPDFRYTEADLISAALDFGRLLSRLSRFQSELAIGGFNDPNGKNPIVVPRKTGARF